MKIGDCVSDITLGVNQNGQEMKVSDFKGRKIVLYFYPKDSTPGCTAEACSLRDNYSELREKGYEVVGVSVDSAKSHQRFIEKNSLPFNLIADTDKRLVEQFGVWAMKKMCGREYMGTLRTTFIIDENGVIENIYDSKTINTKTHGTQILG
ncbi:MAG: thioredoxin-dependent thiol peroxidase [Marinifilaceae bacterium]|nr:thioredoxin-dependent thiol peroxidase [Marinifilaceae bacterium]